jgi:hypothetical protein
MSDPPDLSTYQQYLRLRIECGYPEESRTILEEIWNGCDAEAQEEMLNQLRRAATRLKQHQEQAGREYW